MRSKQIRCERIADKRANARSPHASDAVMHWTSRFAVAVFTVLVCLLAFAVPHAQAASGDDTFMLSVVDHTGAYRVQPAEVPYTSGDSVRDALEASDHNFTFNSSGFITAIGDYDPSDYSAFFTYYFTGYEDYESATLGNAPASDVKAVFITAYSKAGSPGNGHTDLLEQMGEYASRTDGLSNYKPAFSAYNAGLDGLNVATNAAAQTLANNLRDAIAAYDQIMSGTKYTVSFTCKKGSTTVTNSTDIVLTDSYGNKTTVNNGRAQVVAGTYTYEALDADATNGVRCTALKVESDTQVTVNMPTANWFSDVNAYVGPNGYAACEKSGSVANRSVTILVPDTIDELAQLYMDVTPTSSIPSTATCVPFAAYEGLNDFSYTGANASRVGLSAPRTFAPPHLVAPGTKGAQFDYEMRYTVAENTYQVEICHASIERTPTLASLSVQEPAGSESGVNTELVSGFSPYTLSYNVKTTASGAVLVGGAPFDAESGDYSVTVDGEALTSGQDTVEVSLDGVGIGQKKTVEVAVELGGHETCYTVQIERCQGVEVTLAHNANTSVVLQNAAGSTINPTSTTGTASTFTVIDAASYTYVATSTSNAYSHARATFTAQQGATVAAAAPSATDIVPAGGVVLLSSGTFAPKNYYEGGDTAAHESAWTVPDNTAISWLRVNPTNTQKAYTYTVTYERQDSGARYVLPLADSSNASSRVNDPGNYGKVNMTAFQRKGGWGNTALLQVFEPADASGVEYYQDYTINTTRQLTLSDLTMQSGSDKLTLTQAEGSGDSFSSKVYRYTTSVPATTESLDASFMFTAPSNAGDKCAYGYQLRTDTGAVVHDERTPKIYTVNIPITDHSATHQEVRLTVGHEDTNTPEQTYIVDVALMPAVTCTFDVNPADTVVTVIDKATGNKVNAAADGTYSLISGNTYTWRASCSGYVGQSGEITPQEATTVPVTLQAAQANPNINTQLHADWPYFRADANNNSVVDAPIPTKGNDTLLYWAKQLGVGYDSSALGCPILVDGYLYTYASNNIFKLDLVTGEVVAQAKMSGQSSFAITPMTYADGIVFIALANGTIQAFNADTLESLWIFQSEHGGQPNCPITYADGKIYTGFWTGSKAVTDFVCLTVTDENPSQATEKKQALWTMPHLAGFYWAGAYASSDFVVVGSDSELIGSVLGVENEPVASASLYLIDARTGRVLDELGDEYPAGVKVGNIRSTVVYDTQTQRYYYCGRSGYLCSVAVEQTSEGYRFDHDSAQAIRLQNSNATSVSSTTTPVIYNGRAYVGADNGSYSAYDGQCIDVVDLSTQTVAYVMEVAGRAQSTALLTTAHQKDGDESVYLYFIENVTPGKVRVFKDEPGQTEPKSNTWEMKNEGGEEVPINVADVLFCPMGSQSQYCICSPIVDEYGIMYFKNDSAYMMAIGPTIEKIEVTKQPDKTDYLVGEQFDPTGMVVTATYSNGKTRDISKYVDVAENFAAGNGYTLSEQGNGIEVPITFSHTMYQSDNTDTVTGAAPDYNYPKPTTSVTVNVLSNAGLYITTDAVPNANIANNRARLVGEEYSFQLQTNHDAAGKVRWQLTEGALPQGLTLSETGLISGAPDVSCEGGVYPFTAKCTEGDMDCVASYELTLTKVPEVTQAAPPVAYTGKEYTYTFAAEGGYPGELSWHIHTGEDFDQLPAGLVLDEQTGTISGTPQAATAEAGANLAIRADNEAGYSPNKRFRLKVLEFVAPQVQTTELPGAQARESYTCEVPIAGTPAPQVTVSGLPQGLTYEMSEGNLVLRGTPRFSGEYQVLITARNEYQDEDVEEFTLTVAPPVGIDKEMLKQHVQEAETDLSVTKESVDGKDVDPTQHWTTAAARTAFQEAIDQADAVYEQADANDENIEAALNALAEARGVFDAAKQLGTPDKSGLTSALTEAAEVVESVEVQADGDALPYDQDWVTQEVKDAYEAAIAAAQQVVELDSSTVAKIAEALDSLDQAKETYLGSVQNGQEVKADLDELVESAYDDLNATAVSATEGSDLNPDVMWVDQQTADTLAAAVAQAKAVLFQEGVTTGALKSATAALQEASKRFVDFKSEHNGNPDKSALAAALAKAGEVERVTATSNPASLADGTVYVDAALEEELDEAIRNGEGVMQMTRTIEQIGNATKRLEDAVDAYNKGKKTYKKPTETVKPADTTKPGTSAAAAKAKRLKQMGSDGTALGAGASAEAAEAVLVKLSKNTDPKGSQFGKLQLKSTKQTKNSVKLTWKKPSGTKKFVVYGAKSGKKLAKLATVTAKKYTAKKVAGKKLSKGAYYKFVVVALNAKNNVVSTSKMAHVATAGGKKANPKKVTAKSKVTVKKGKKTKLKAKQKAPSKGKVKTIRKLAYESSNPKVATVTKAGKVKGCKKGSCTIYAYAQNGVCKAVKVKVK